jgi:general secretion pathway protein D
MKRYACIALPVLLAALIHPGDTRAQGQSGEVQPLAGMQTAPRLRSMYLAGNVAEVIQQAFRLYGMDVIFAGPIQGLARPIQIDLRDASLATTGRVLDAMTHCFFVPLDAHLVLAVQDDKEHRSEYEQAITETIEIPNMQSDNAEEQGEVVGLLRTVFGISKAAMYGNTVTVQATKREMVQIVRTLTQLFQPAPQVLLEVKAYILSTAHNRNTGVETPQQITVFNVDTEAENLITSNASVVEGLIESGLVSAGDTLGITEALIAEGYGSGSVLSNPFVYFGGGETATGVEFGSASANLNLTSSTSQELQDVMLHLANDQPGTLKIGQRYPIMTASTSTVGGSASSTTPTIEYEDLGITLEAKPHIKADGEIVLHIHEAFRSLDGTGLDGIPIIDNQEFVSDLSVQDGITTVIVSNLSKTETRTAQGLTNFVPTDNAGNQQTSDLVVTITPVITRAGPER